MKIVFKQPQKTADVSSARGTAGREFREMVIAAALLLIVLYLLTGWVVDLIVAHISFETEARIFPSYHFKAIESTAQEKSERFQAAEAILDRLRSAAQVPPLPYRLILVDQPEPNAFAFPGGTIGVTRGLMTVLNQDIEIAFVLGHEIGHFKNRDHLRGLGRMVGFGIISAIVMGNGSGGGSIGNIINFVLQRNYSQAREKAADRFGLKLVYAAYGKVEGCDRLFNILNKQNKIPKWAYMFATHPSPEKRIQALELYAKQLTAEKSH